MFIPWLNSNERENVKLTQNQMEKTIIDTKYHSIVSATSSTSHQKLADLLLIFHSSTYMIPTWSLQRNHKSVHLFQK